MKVSHLAVVAAVSSVGFSFYASVARAEAPAAAPADKKMMMEMPKPSAEMEKLKTFFSNNEWKCSGTAGMPGTPMHAVSAKIPMKTELNGMWHMARYEEKKTKENPMPFQAVDYFTYDMANKVFLRTSMDSMGNMMSMTAANMEGDKMMFQGDNMMNGSKMPMRMTFEKKGKDMSVAMESSGSDGSWTKTMDLMCKK